MPPCVSSLPSQPRTSSKAGAVSLRSPAHSTGLGPPRSVQPLSGRGHEEHPAPSRSCFIPLCSSLAGLSSPAYIPLGTRCSSLPSGAALSLLWLYLPWAHPQGLAAPGYLRGLVPLLSPVTVLPPRQGQAEAEWPRSRRKSRTSAS